MDGREEVIRRANLFFRAVPLPAGNHTVEFRYEPRSFTVGLAISAATLVALIVVTTLVSFPTLKKIVRGLESSSREDEPVANSSACH